jgi:ABC-type polysaccharide/polyol phosphate export permease
MALAAKDFKTRYKRASFGTLWAVALPLLQAFVLAFVFSRVAKFGGDIGGVGFGAYVLSGMVAYSYFAGSVLSAATAVVDGSGLADKVWFPRAVLVLVPLLSNLIGFGVSTVLALALAPALDGSLSATTLLVIPGVALLLAFTTALSLVLSALYVYFRDVKFIVQAALLVWLYISPVIYDPAALLGRSAGWLDLNPLTGIIALFHASVGVEGVPVLRPVLVSLAFTVVLLVAGTEAHRRHDRLFVDLL